MRRSIALLTAVLWVVAVGCGPNTPTEYSGPAITPVTGKGAAGNYGPPGEAPPDAGPKGPPKPPGGR